MASTWRYSSIVRCSPHLRESSSSCSRQYFLMSSTLKVNGVCVMIGCFSFPVLSFLLLQNQHDVDTGQHQHDHCHDEQDPGQCLATTPTPSPAASPTPSSWHGPGVALVHDWRPSSLCSRCWPAINVS